MSAIWGMISFQSTIPTHIDSRMRSYYTNHCKLDRCNFIQQPNLYFGCGIQHVTPEANREILPYYDESRKICFTADCLLDNRQELLHLLGESDLSLPDGALMLSAFYRFGMKCVNYFRGLYSFAVYDMAKNILYLAADQLSSRCLYYYRTKEQLTFSTLLTPLRSLHNNLSINQLYLKDYLTSPGLMPSIVSNETPYEQVYKLNPGTYLEITPSSLKEVSYWSPSAPFHCHCKSPNDYGTYFRSLYNTCVQDALRTNGQVGIALSSGLDSSSVGAIAADYLDKENKHLYTYTYVPSEPIKTDKNTNHIHNETEDVMEIVKMHPNMIPHFLCNEGKNCFDEIPSGIQVLEIPYKAHGNLPSLFEIYKKASTHSCKVMLSGQLGNSTISYGYIDDILYDLYSRGKYRTFLSYLNHYCKTVKESRKKALQGCIKYFKHAKMQYRDSRFQYTPDNPFLKQSIKIDYPMEERYSTGELSIFKGELPTPRHMYQRYLCMRAPYTYMGELETKAGLAFGMILRDPTKDMRILNFCYHLPYHLFANQGIPRWLVRQHSRDLLPAFLLDNWMRYGVQNSDCHERLVRDWNQLYPIIKEQLTSNEIAPWVQQEAVLDYLNRTKLSLSSKNELETQYLMNLNVLYSFLNNTCENTYESLKTLSYKLLTVLDG